MPARDFNFERGRNAGLRECEEAKQELRARVQALENQIRGLQSVVLEQIEATGRRCV
jgi:hypothetical protein